MGERTSQADGVRFEGIVMVEGLPGSGKTTVAGEIAAWLGATGTLVQHWPEGRSDHPVDFENVSLLTDDALRSIADDDAASGQAVRAHAERHPGGWVVRDTDRLEVRDDIARRIRGWDAYDGDITAQQHGRALAESWRRYGAAAPRPGVQVWECALIQNPVCAFIARFDRPPGELTTHVQGLVAAVRRHSPALVYLDPGDPALVLPRVSAERPDWWREFVIGYHTGQGYGLRVGLEGFEGYVEFMRMRRSLELALLPQLDLPTLVVETAGRSRQASRERIRAFVGEHLTAAHA